MPQPPSSRRSLIEAIVASTIGTTIEWYDFFLYGTMAALVFPGQFFPGESEFAGQMLSFGTFSVGFIARPVGGALFGYLGDRVGRKSTLVATLLLMGVSTVSIGFLPNFHQIGGLAPLMLVILRFIQGLGVGGEWGGSVLLALEYGHEGKRGFYASWPQAGVPLGLLASTGAVALFKGTLSTADFEEWGWRVPFYLSGLLIAVGLLIRVRIMETPLFRELQESEQIAKDPIGEVIRSHWREILLAAGARVTENACFYLFTVYILSYGENVLHMDSGIFLAAVNIAAAIEFFTIPLFGMVSDHWSRKRTYVAGCLYLALWSFPFFALLHTREPVFIILAVVVGLAGGHAMLYSVQASLIPELFGTRLRYTGASLGYQLAAPLAGGTAPLIGAALAKAFPGQFWPLALYIILMSAISLVSVLLLAETSKKDIRG